VTNPIFVSASLLLVHSHTAPLPRFTCFLVKVSFTLYCSFASANVSGKFFHVHAKKLTTMRLSDFILLSENEKKHTVFYQGTPIAKRDCQQYKVFLFQLENYYVEAFCNLQNKAIEEYRVFGDTQLLQPYLQAIPLDDLIN